MSSTVTRDRASGPSPAVRRRRPLLAAAGLLVVVVAVVGVLVTRGGGDPKAPYRDAAVVGSIALCDAHGHQVTSGPVTGRPLAWRAVGSTPAPAPYAVHGRTATLYGYQPRAGVEPQEWSGMALTAAGYYTAPAHPTAAATTADYGLRQFLGSYPAHDEGFVQLRLYLGGPNLPQRSRTYDALDLHVDGGTWHAVGGGTVDCSAVGTSTSLETLVGSH